MEADLAGLPPVAARYLRAMGVVGRPRTWSLRAHLTGRFRRGPGQPWLPCDAWQYDSAVEVARLFRMRLVVARVVPMWGWDTYRAGTGQMLGKALGLVTVADGSGPEFDIGELTTWLNDAVLLAPGMLVHPRTTWQPVSDDGFRVAVTDAGHTVSAEVLLDDDDRPRDFRTEDRWIDLPEGPVRAPWSTPVRGWTVVDGRPGMTGGGGRLAAARRRVHLRRDGPGRPGPRRPPGPVSSVLRALLLAAAGAAGLQAVHLRRNRGATADEATATLPGDELVPAPAEDTTLAVTLHAPAEEVWAWLVQIGQGRGGCTATTALRT